MTSILRAQWHAIVGFEMAIQVRRRSTWLFVVVFLLLLLGQTNGQVIDAQDQGVFFNAPLFLADSSVMMGLIALLVMAAIAGDAATRDVQTRLEPIMLASPIGRAVYLGGRFVGAFLTIALVLLAIPAALLVAPLLNPALAGGAAGPVSITAHLHAWFILVLPNAFIATAIGFSLAFLMRHPIGSYLGAGLVFSAVLLCTQFIGGVMGQWELAALLNPAGETSLRLMANTWSPTDLNTRLVGLGGGLLWNRLFWLGIGSGALLFTHARFRQGKVATTARWGLRRAEWGARITPDAPLAEVSIPTVVPQFGATARIHQTVAVTRDSLREVAGGWLWVAVPIAAFFLLLGPEMLHVRGTPTLPTTARVIEGFGNAPPPLIIALFVFIILFAGELIWRERDARMHVLVDAAPVPIWPRFAGKVLGLWIAIVAFQVLRVLTGIVIQARLGWYDFDILLYLRTVLGLDLIAPMMFALFAISVHVLVHQKHVGHLVVLTVTLGGGLLAQLIGVEHPLLVPLAMPGWRFSPISGLDPHLGPFLWFRAYWTAWALLIAVVAGLFWMRGADSTLRARATLARQRLTGWTAMSVAGAATLVMLVGGIAFYNTNMLNAYESSAAAPRRQAEYERRYARFGGATQPQLTATTLDVELYPDGHGATVRGVHHLVNRSSHAIDTVHVAVSWDVTTSAIAFGRSARATTIDDDLGHRVYVLADPLQPGDSLRMMWEVQHAPRGFSARPASQTVLRNGSFIETHNWIPTVGYQRWRELSSATDRRTHALPARPATPSLTDTAAQRDPTGKERIRLEATVGTAAGQTAVAPGELRRTWTRDGRNYFHYVTDEPIGPGYAIFSAVYEVRRKRTAAGVTIEVVHHPAHGANVDRMMHGIEASLDQYAQRFGPYPQSELRFVEYPGDGGSGLHAANGVVWYQAGFSLFDPGNDPRNFDLVFAVVAHEVAHQFQPLPARVEGSALLSESFAWYAAMGVIEQVHGADHLERFLDFMREDFLDPRARADVPLLRASESFVAYRKGPFAMHALRQYVGQAEVDRAWRRLREHHATGEPPFATSLDLMREFRAVTPDSLQYLLGDLFERNTFWELQAHGARSMPLHAGGWQVTLDVEARKVAVDTAGVETAIPMNDLVEIGAYGVAKGGAATGNTLHRAMHRVRTGRQVITFIVAEEPVRAGIDPRRLLVDVTPSDNVVEVSGGR